MCSLALDSDLHSDRSLAPAFDHPVTRFHHYCEISAKDVFLFSGQSGKAVVHRGDLLAVVEDETHTGVRFGDVVGELRRDSQAALHVYRAQTEQSIAFNAVREVSCGRHGVEVTSDDNAGLTHLRNERVARSSECQVRKSAQCSFERVSDLVLVMGLAGNIDEGGCDIDNVSRQINARGHVDTVAA
jgi:hypothetical protein